MTCSKRHHTHVAAMCEEQHCTEMFQSTTDFYTKKKILNKSYPVEKFTENRANNDTSNTHQSVLATACTGYIPVCVPYGTTESLLHPVSLAHKRASSSVHSQLLCYLLRELIIGTWNLKIMASSGKQWQCQLFSPSERLAYLRNSGHLSDLIITFPGHSTVLQSHRLLLAMSSPVFEAMLYGPLAGDDTLALPEDPPEAFEWLLNHLYMNETQLPDLTLAAKVYLLASKYQLDNVCKICSEVLANETDEVLKSPRVEALGRRALALMLTHEKLFASTEVLVFDALIRWLVALSHFHTPFIS
ncbi:BTB/POZ domain-containing protein 3, partial [Penaeus vannamei]|uniref:BTB/POZ domain-containing protein 3 n=1 Tax=Penaeus vannamei TaxID=6689 RepID=UPI00387F9C05